MGHTINLLRKRTHPFPLLRSVNRLDPLGPMFREDFDAGLEHSVM